MTSFKIKFFLIIGILGSLVSACSIVPELTQRTNVDTDPTMLTVEQHAELLNMLNKYKDNDDSIQQWKQSQAGVIRLLTIESDLRILIEQLNELNGDSQLNEKEESKSDEIENKQIASQPSQGIKPEQGNKIIGLHAIQLLAMSSPESVLEQWRRLVDAYPELLGDLSPASEKVERLNGAIYRLKAGPFESKNNSISRCKKLLAVNISCVVSQYSENAKHLPTN